MVDALLSKADKEEELSRIYARAVAAGAGYVTSVPEYDRDGATCRFGRVATCARQSTCS